MTLGKFLNLLSVTISRDRHRKQIQILPKRYFSEIAVSTQVQGRFMILEVLSFGHFLNLLSATISSWIPRPGCSCTECTLLIFVFMRISKSLKRKATCFKTTKCKFVLFTVRRLFRSWKDCLGHEVTWRVSQCTPQPIFPRSPCRGIAVTLVVPHAARQESFIGDGNSILEGLFGPPKRLSACRNCYPSRCARAPRAPGLRTSTHQRRS